VTDDDRTIYKRIADNLAANTAALIDVRKEMRDRRTPRVSVETVVLCLAGALIVGGICAACAQ
jgi:hypothetical protein